MLDVVVAEPSLDAQAVVVGGPVPALHRHDLVIVGLVGDLAADTAIRTHAAGFLELQLSVQLVFIHERRLHQGAGGASLDTLAAGHAGTLAHGVVEVEYDLRVGAAVSHADHVVHLHLAAGAHTQATVDAGVEVHAHGHVTVVGGRCLLGGEAAFGQPDSVGPPPEDRLAVMRPLPWRLVSQQQFEHAAAGLRRPVALAVDHHAVAWLAQAGRRQNALALDLHHAGAAVAVRPVAGLW